MHLSVRIGNLGMIVVRIVLNTMNTPQTIRNVARGELTAHLTGLIVKFVTTGPTVMRIEPTNSNTYTNGSIVLLEIIPVAVALGTMSAPQTLTTGALGHLGSLLPKVISLFITRAHPTAMDIGSIDSFMYGRNVVLGMITVRIALSPVNAPQALPSLLVTRTGTTLTCMVSTHANMHHMIRIGAPGMTATRMDLKTQSTPQILRANTREVLTMHLATIFGLSLIENRVRDHNSNQTVPIGARGMTTTKNASRTQTGAPGGIVRGIRLSTVINLLTTTRSLSGMSLKSSVLLTGTKKEK